MSITLPAPAKINLHLQVTHIRRDGMHELDTSFAYTDLCDELLIDPADELIVTCSDSSLSGESNLVYQLLDAFRTEHAINAGLHVHINKHIPARAGLGGGSSDAATALLAANRLWGTQQQCDALIRFAAPFGADIPCFLFGEASLATGIGEQLIPYPAALPQQTLLLVWPGEGLSTQQVFRHFDQHVLNGDHSLTPNRGLDTIRRDLSSLGINDLEHSACSLSEKVAALLQTLRLHTHQAWMSGSGSTCVALFDDSVQADIVAAHLKMQHPEYQTHVGTIRKQHPLDRVYWDVAKR